MKQQKKVSVIVPCYNVEQYIDRCFRSLKNQTIGMEHIEIIFVDDASTDGTWEKILQFEVLYPENIVAIHNEVNKRQGYCRNVALDYATAKYVSFVDSDDWLELCCLDEMYAKAEQYRCDIVSCNCTRDFPDGRTLKVNNRELEEGLFIKVDDLEKRKALFVRDMLGSGMICKLIRKEFLLENNIYSPEGMRFEDGPWGSICYYHVEAVYIMKEYLYHYFANDNSTVLQKNQTYYDELFAANYYKWEQLHQRGCFDVMKQEAEFDFMCNYYLMGLKLFGKHYDRIPIEAFFEMKSFILENIPDYKNNPYIKTALAPEVSMLFEFIDREMGENELRILHGILKKMTI